MADDRTYNGPENVEVLITYSDPDIEAAGLGYAHQGDAGCDLRCVQGFELKPFERALVPTGYLLRCLKAMSGWSIPVQAWP